MSHQQALQALSAGQTGVAYIHVSLNVFLDSVIVPAPLVSSVLSHVQPEPMPTQRVHRPHLSSSMVWRCKSRGRRPVPEHGASSMIASKLSGGNLHHGSQSLVKKHATAGVLYMPHVSASKIVPYFRLTLGGERT